VWNLPTIFVCENNLYMEYTSIGDVTPVVNPAADRAVAYGLEPILVDGNDADDVYMAAAAALDRARDGGGPSLIEAKTYRHGGHSRADPGKYRPDEEVERWLERDPVPMYHQRLLRLGVGEDVLGGISQRSTDAVEDATRYAVDGPEPALESVFRDVWADGGSSWRN
jgi:acetoin:2,6-dichlorophenolindophenol oxidoreductase subunit alpha